MFESPVRFGTFDWHDGLPFGMGLHKAVFKQRSAKKIAAALKHSAEARDRRTTLEKAKENLRKDFGKTPKHSN